MSTETDYRDVSSIIERAKVLRNNYDHCTRLLEEKNASIKQKMWAITGIINTLSQWYDCHMHHRTELEPIVTIAGMTAFKAALADVLPQLPIRKSADVQTKCVHDLVKEYSESTTAEFEAADVQTDDKDDSE